MRIRGGHILRAKARVGLAGLARSALALAMAVFFVAQSAALPAQGARAGHGAFGQKCERSGASSSSGDSRAPSTRATHECEACLACVFSSFDDTRLGFHVVPIVASRIAVSCSRSFTALLARWRAAHPARAPPSLS
ncbi:hypothetical protein [Methylocystis sp. S23]